MNEALKEETESENSITVSDGIYARYIKRLADLFLSLAAIIVLSPILLVLTVIGAVVMKGNPFFVQERPGKNEKIFKLIKFRTMTCEKDKDGNLLPDDKRLTGYGNFLRHTSIDELPELINILKGDMAIVGPRPLLVKYLPLYNKEQRHRHDVRPGLTGLAQINGRNSLSWEDRFEMDLQYVKSISLSGDIGIIVCTVKKVFVREGISSATSETMEEFTGTKTVQKEKV
ncbi:MAG: sugar transferase [Acutalibacteraceae bacterium]